MTDTENPLLSKIRLPGKRFRLPSRGLFYTNDELAESVTDGEIEVFSMTTIDEISLRSPEFLFSGEALDKVIKRCVPEVNEPLKLLSRDVDYILACLRIVSYGGTYQINTRCPECEKKQEQINALKMEAFLAEIEEKAKEQEVSYNLALLDDKVQKRIEAIKNKQSTEHTYNVNLAGILQNNTIEITDEEFAKYHTVLPNEQVVCFTPLKMSSAVAVQQFQNDTNTLDLNTLEEYVAFMIASSILSVDDITDWDMICEWSKKLPVPMKEKLEEATVKFSPWGTDFTYNVVCKEEDCGYERNISALLNPITFFMTPSG